MPELTSLCDTASDGRGRGEGDPMKKTITGLAAILIIGLIVPAQEHKAPTAPGQESKPPAVSMSLNDCIVKALEKNLDISVAAFGPEISNAGITQAGEPFLPAFSLGYFSYRLNQPSSWGIEGPDIVQRNDA